MSRICFFFVLIPPTPKFLFLFFSFPNVYCDLNFNCNLDSLTYMWYTRFDGWSSHFTSRCLHFILSALKSVYDTTKVHTSIYPDDIVPIFSFTLTAVWTLRLTDEQLSGFLQKPRSKYSSHLIWQFLGQR